MQTNRKKIGILLIIIGLILILLIIYFGFIKKSPATLTEVPVLTVTAQLPPSAPETGTTTPGDKPRNRQTYDISKEAPHKFSAVDLTKMAMAFAERLGSYSDYSNYGNFTDLKIFMTDSLKSWVDKYVEQLKKESKNNGAYYGLVTKALTTEVKSFDDQAGIARVIVTTKRSESTERMGGGTSYTQKIDISFVKVNGEWLVDKAYWESK